MSKLPSGWGNRCNQKLDNEKDTSKSNKDDVSTQTSTLPSGWGNRNNQMSEKDIKLGGVAATKFGGTAKNAYENSTEGGDITYKTSDEVREYYLSEMQRTGGGDNPQEKSKSNVPSFWEDRQKEKMIQAKQMGVFSKNTTSNDTTIRVDESKVDTTIQKKRSIESDGSNNDTTTMQSAEVALIQIATHTLEKVAQSLEGKDVKIPIEERAAFAQAMKKAMNALAKQT